MANLRGYGLRLQKIVRQIVANRRLVSQMGRLSIATLPLLAVLGLCFMMVGWRGKSHAQEPHPIQKAPEAVSKAPDGALAAFQQRHITHSTVRVPQ